MPWRQIRYLLDAEVQASDVATRVIKLPLSNVLHSLFLEVTCRTGATNAKNLDIDDVVDRIEIIANGSEVILSLTPAELRRWIMLDMGKPMIETVNEAPAQPMAATYPLLFGREEWDPNFYLPCARFSDLELRITYSPTIGATAWAPGTVTFTVIALMTMGGDPGPYQGTLRKTTLFDFTTVASGDTVIDLPRRLLYSRGLVFCYRPGIEDGLDITRVKLGLNNDERVPMNLRWTDLKEWNAQMFDLIVRRSMRIHRANNDIVNTKIANISMAKVHPLLPLDFATHTFPVANADVIAGDAVTLDFGLARIQATFEALTADATNRAAILEVRGVGLPHAVVIPFAHLNGGPLWDPKKFDMVQLTLTNGGAGATCRLSLEEALVVK